MMIFMAPISGLLMHLGKDASRRPRNSKLKCRPMQGPQMKTGRNEQATSYLRQGGSG